MSLYAQTMADPATFGHDNLGHLLSDKLLEVPRFQRRYSWKSEHVQAYIDDIESARSDGNSYFMGTIVLAHSRSDESRTLIVDGQQRIITTALTLIAIRDLLQDYGQMDAGSSVERDYLSNYDLEHEENVERLKVGPDDIVSYRNLLKRETTNRDSTEISDAYCQVSSYLKTLAPSPDEYKSLINLATFLRNQVQVLVATATGLGEAYVIFETLNDRGADLTTADLLKNYLFSQSGSSIEAAENHWTIISSAFEKPDDFVKFLRYEYMSRRGRVTQKQLYKAIQRDIQNGPGVILYLKSLMASLSTYRAIREPDDPSWSSESIDVKDSLLAFRRFGFESSIPLMLAVFREWKHSYATKFVSTVVSWSVRSWFSGTLGGGVAEKAFSEAAVSVTKGAAKNALDVLKILDVNDLIPNDIEFRESFKKTGPLTTTRAKYLLATLERQYVIDRGESPDALPDWSSKSVTIEHIFAKSSKPTSFASEEDFDHFSVIRDQLTNYTLLERGHNQNLEDHPFNEKRATYAASTFELTREVANCEEWTFDSAETRLDNLANLAVEAWPK